MSAPLGSRRADVDPDHDGRLPLLVGAGVVVLVLLLAVGGGYLLLSGDDTAQTPSAGASGTAADVPAGTASDGTAGDGTEATEPTEEPDPLDDPMSPESIDLRYARLGSAVTTGTDRCRSAKVRKGQEERLRCDVSTGTLELVTWTTGADLDTHRAEVVTDEPGGVLDTGRDRTLMAFQGTAAPQTPDKGKGKGKTKGAQDDTAPAGSTFLYWDDGKRRSGTYLAEADTELALLAAAYDATGPVRAYPTGLSDTQLVAFAKRWVGTGECLRTVTVNAGALEESYCDVKGPVEMFVGRFRSPEALRAYRTLVVASAIADGRELRDWRAAPGGDTVGALYEYTTDDGTVARYWDADSCLCYAEAFLADGSYQRLARWWDR